MVPPGKEERLRKGARDILCRAARHRRWLPVRVLAGFAGLAQSVQLALPLARLYLRGIFDVIKTKRSWESDPPLHTNRRRKARVAREMHICWSSCRLRQRRGHSATTISDGGGHRQSRATLNETTNYARATRMTVTPNKKWCWFLGQYRRRLSWAADRRHDQNQASPPSGDDELELALVAARD